MRRRPGLFGMKGIKGAKSLTADLYTSELMKAVVKMASSSGGKKGKGFLGQLLR